MPKSTSEAAFETAIESILLADGYLRLDANGFDRERAIFPDEAPAFIRATQGKVWEKLEALHGEQTGARVLEVLCKWLDTHGALATLRHGFKCFGRRLRIAFFRPAPGLNRSWRRATRPTGWGSPANCTSARSRKSRWMWCCRSTASRW